MYFLFQAFAVFYMLYAFFKLQTPGNYPKESIQNMYLFSSYLSL